MSASNLSRSPSNVTVTKTWKSSFKSGPALAVYFFLFNLFLGAIVFTVGESHTFLEGFYFSCVTLTTVGYGDFYFQSVGGRVFAIFWIIIGTISMARMLSAVIDSKAAEIASMYAEKKNKRLLMKKTDFSLLDKDGSGKVDKFEFLTYKLVSLGRCEQWHIDDIINQFDAMDEDRSGTLELEDFKKQAERESQELRMRILATRRSQAGALISSYVSSTLPPLPDPSLPFSPSGGLEMDRFEHQGEGGVAEENKREYE